MRKSILITGVAGLIGSRMADWIVENHPEYEVVGIDNLFGGYMENVNENVVFYKRELGEDDISDIFEKHNFEYVYHFAAYAAEGLSYFMPVFNDRNNMLSTDNIIKECVKHNVKRLIYTSSMAVYGEGVEVGKIFDEDDRPHPVDPYGMSKYACERNIEIIGNHFGLDWCIIRPHNVYGVKQNIWDKYRNVLGIWIYQISVGRRLLTVLFSSRLNYGFIGIVNGCPF
jgi:UDP-glucose 4-epimerase